MSESKDVELALVLDSFSDDELVSALHRYGAGRGTPIVTYTRSDIRDTASRYLSDANQPGLESVVEEVVRSDDWSDIPYSAAARIEGVLARKVLEVIVSRSG